MIGLDLPLELPPGSSVLVAGCGGGFDIVAGLPVALRLRALGHRVHLANYCVGDVARAEGATQPIAQLWRVGPDARDPEEIRGFPEGAVARWWSKSFAEERPVWCLGRAGVRPLREAFAYLARELALDAIVLTDGGVDGLFLGHEHDTGTPSMDAITILSAAAAPVAHKFFIASAFGTEGTAYSVRHADVLERMAELTRQDAFLGVAALVRNSDVGRHFEQAVEAVHACFSKTFHSIIVSSILAGMHGRFGEVNLTPRTDWHPIWISPLQTLYWAFLLDPIAAAKPYRAEVMESETVEEVAEAIERARDRIGVGPRTVIPI